MTLVLDNGSLARGRQILVSVIHGNLLRSRNVLAQMPFFIDLVLILRFASDE